MPQPRPFPRKLRGRTFVAQHALDLGATRERLRANDVHRIATGLYFHQYGTLEAPPSELAQIAALRYSRPHLWLAHTSAARAHGFWLPARLQQDPHLHIAAEPGLSIPRAQGFTGHAFATTTDEVSNIGVVGGAPLSLSAVLSTPARTWLDLAPALTLDELITLGDQLVRIPRQRYEGRSQPWATPSSLTRLLANRRGYPGVVQARKALTWVRIGSDSPRETQLRLAIIRSGLPEPVLQVRANPGNPYSATADMGYPARKLALQYEGNHHRTREQYARDLRRNEEFASHNWRTLHVTDDDAREDYRRLLGTLHGFFSSHQQGSPTNLR